MFAWNWVKCPHLYRKLMFGNLHPIGKGWGQFTYTFVLDIALLCTLKPNPKPLWWCGELGNKLCQFLYILCILPQNIVFSDMAQCPSPNIKFLQISGDFMLFPAERFLMNWAQTLWRGEGIKNMNFVYFWTFHWISIMNDFHELVPHAFPLLHGGVVAKHEFYVKFFTFHVISSKKTFLTLTLTPHSWEWHFREHGFPVQIWTFHLIPNENFGFKLTLSMPNVTFNFMNGTDFLSNVLCH